MSCSTEMPECGANETEPAAGNAVRITGSDKRALILKRGFIITFISGFEQGGFDFDAAEPAELAGQGSDPVRSAFDKDGDDAVSAWSRISHATENDVRVL